MSPIISAANDAQTAAQQLQKRSAASQFRNQWGNPSDIFSLLLIIGPEIIKAALSQQAGCIFTPAVFSFGWVAYAFNSLLAVFGDTRMTPNPDFPAQVINAKYRHVRDNKAWIIGRLLRDQELSRRYAESATADHGGGTDDAVRNQDFQMSFFRYDQDAVAGEIRRDAVWYSGFAVMLLQLVVSIVPFVTHRNWAPVTVTAGGTVLALLHGAIPQWKSEKWSRVADIDSTVCITQGNGSRYVMVILGSDGDGSKARCKGLDIELLASGSKRFRFSLLSRATSVGLAVLWIVLLISVTGLEEDTWYLMAVGLIGMVHSIYVAGAARHPSALGIHLVEEKGSTIKKPMIAEALREAEKRYPFIGVGSSLIPTFFPGGMRIPQDDVSFWTVAAKRRKLQGIEQLHITVEDPLPERSLTSLV
ncbi:hypothetical protein SLS58_007124 [Diplodia intermedia]|uniref:Uncharacterized protein n=1 Tax=Diplodia intermedia TaxID=856260 RepID=A0ABR3TKU0_9PEZI